MKKAYLIGLCTIMLIIVLINPAPSSLDSNKEKNINKTYESQEISYLYNKFPNEEIRIVATDTYRHFETEKNYTRIKAFHNNKPITIVVDQEKNRVDESGLIEKDYKEYLDSIPKPYRKMESDLRIKVKERFNKFPTPTELNESVVLNEKFDVILFANNTQDLVKIAKKINSVAGFPTVWNGENFKFVETKINLPIILNVLEMNATKSASLNYVLRPIIGHSTGSEGVKGTYLQDTIGLNGSGVRVSILDSGVGNGSELSPHPDLPPITLLPPTVPTTNVSYDKYGHGTHVAGILASRNNTYRGMAPGATYFSIKVLDDSGSGTVGAAISGIDKSITAGMKVISMSIGAEEPTPNGESDFAKKVDSAVYENGTTIVISTGNYDKITVPADAYNSVSVGATVGYSNNYDRVWDCSWWEGSCGSGRGTTNDSRYKVDVVAPGKDIYSTMIPNGTVCGDGCNCQGQWAYCTGTSMAAPHVSGLATLLYQYLKNNNRPMNPLIVKAAILNSAKKIKRADGSAWTNNGNSQQPLDTDQGAGFIDSQEAYNTLNDAGRIYIETIKSYEEINYYINITDTSKNLTLTLTWNRHVTKSGSISFNDLDLYLFNSSGNQIKESNSFDDNVEHIYYTVPSTGKYKVQIYNSGTGTETYALASSNKMKREFNQNLVSGWNLISLPVNVDE